MPYVDLTYQDNTRTPLSGAEMKFLNPDAKIMTYPELYDYKTIEELFSENKKIIILYLLQSKHIGHWTTLFINQDGINFFDSYGVMPDYELELLSKDKRKQLDEEQDYLKNHLLKDYKTIYNNITYQGTEKGISSCGCFVSHRLAYSYLDNKQYLNIFISSGMKPDDLVSKWCFSKL